MDVDQIKVVVADDSNEIIEVLQEHFHSHPIIKIVATAANGRECVSMIEQHRPHVVLLDNVMPQLDGMGVLEHIANSDVTQIDEVKIIMCTAFAKDEIIKRAANYGAHYFISKPFDLAQLEKEIIHSMQTEATSQLLDEQQVMTLLKNLSIPSHLKGFTYLVEAILLVYKHHQIINAITREVYPKVALAHNASSDSVERAIRTAITQSWSKPTTATKKEIFGDEEKPSNAQFIAKVSTYLK